MTGQHDSRPSDNGVNAGLEDISRKLVWWEEPKEALSNPLRFVAQVMALGTWREVQFTRKFFGSGAFRRVLEAPPSGVFDEASWAYWRNVFSMRPVPPLPKRKLPE